MQCSAVLVLHLVFRTEIKQHLNYIGVMAIIPEEKLSLAGKHNYDIALLRLDRDGVFGLDMSPICLDSESLGVALDGFPLTSTHNQDENAVFISGFGITHYKKKNSYKHPECSTNHFLPRPFHSKIIKSRRPLLQSLQVVTVSASQTRARLPSPR